MEIAEIKKGIDSSIESIYENDKDLFSRENHEMTKTHGEHDYKLGVFIDFSCDKDDLIVKYFEDGKECN